MTATVVGRVIRRRQPLSLRMLVSSERLPGPYGIARLRVRTENITDWVDSSGSRGEVVLRSPVATHLILAVTPGVAVRVAARTAGVGQAGPRVLQQTSRPGPSSSAKRAAAT